MSYIDSLLADGEVIVRREHQHWLSLLIDAWHGWLLFVAGVVVLVASLMVKGDGSGLGGTFGNLLAIVAFVGLVVGLAIIVLQVWRWRNLDYLVTNRRVIQVNGVFNKRAGDSSLEKINDAILDQSLFGRMFHYGDLDILTAQDSAIDRFKMLPQPAAFKREMLNQKHQLEMEMAYRPAPPLRAEAPGRGEWQGQPAAYGQPPMGYGQAGGPGYPQAQQSWQQAAPPPAPERQEGPAWGHPPNVPMPDGPNWGQPAATVAGPGWTQAPVLPPTVPAAPAVPGEATARQMPAEPAPVPPPVQPAPPPPSPASPSPAPDPAAITATLDRLADLRDRGAITPDEYEAKKAELLSRL